MEKVVLHSEETFYEYCKLKCIGHIQRTYGSQWCDINDGKKSEFSFKCNDEFVQVPTEPLRYPCVFVWYEDCDDYQRGMFVYEDDFTVGFKHMND
jgi:hypothetical protein